MTQGEDFIRRIRKNFIARVEKITNIDYSNISGEIGENLVLSIISNNEFELAFYDIGDLTENEML